MGERRAGGKPRQVINGSKRDQNERREGGDS